MLEDLSRGRTSDFVFLYLFGAVSLLVLDFGFWWTGILNAPLILGPSLSFMVLYVWARRNPDVRMNFLGFFTFNAPYLPYVIIGLEFMLGQHWSVYDLFGIVVGHVYWYIMHSYPDRMNREPLLKTPRILSMIFDRQENEIENIQINQMND